MDKDYLKMKAVRVEADNGITHWVKEDHAQGYVAPMEKTAIEKQNRILTQKAEVRSARCWQDNCRNAPRVWVREIIFDLFKLGSPVTLSGVNTDYTGPIPGFCFAHEVSSVPLLAEIVYKTREEMQWGYYPSRAVVVFTDGSRTELLAETFQPRIQIDATDTHESAHEPRPQTDSDDSDTLEA